MVCWSLYIYGVLTGIELLAGPESTPPVLAVFVGGQVRCGSGEEAFAGGCFGGDRLGGLLEFLVHCLYLLARWIGTAIA